jgi:guanylate kinase
MRGTLYIVAAPSGCRANPASSTRCWRAIRTSPVDLVHLAAPRPGERHAQHYHFIGADEFKAMIAEPAISSSTRWCTATGRAPRGSRWNRSWPPVATCCWKSTGRARARCAPRCPTRSACSSCRHRAPRWKSACASAGRTARTVIRQRLAAAREEMSPLRRIRLRDRQRGFRDRGGPRCAASSPPAACAKDAQVARHSRLITSLLVDD